jgi:hypothetical protein
MKGHTAAQGKVFGGRAGGDLRVPGESSEGLQLTMRW